jgi:rod shape-determining protein MreD
MISKKKIIYLLLIFFVVLLQKNFLPSLLGNRNYFDMVLMLVLAWTILDGFSEFLPWAIFIGGLYDLLFYFPIGVHIILFSLVAYLVSFFSKRFSVNMRSSGIFIIIFFIFTASLASNFLDIFMINGGLNFWKIFKENIFKENLLFYELIINGILFLVCYLLIKRIKKLVTYF